MPLLRQIAQDVTEPTSTLQARAETSSEAVALPNGERALTPIIAGSISGACIGTAWLIALIVALVNYLRKRRHYKRVGKPPERPPPGVYIVPPDPAVIQGQRQPGERIEIEKDRRWWELARWKDAVVGGKHKGKGKDNNVDEKERATGPTSGPPSPEVDENTEVSTPGPSRAPLFNRLSTIMSMNSDRSVQQIDGLPIRGAMDQSAPASSYLSRNLQQDNANSRIQDDPGPSSVTSEENGNGHSDDRAGITEESSGESSGRPLHRYPPSN